MSRQNTARKIINLDIKEDIRVGADKSLTRPGWKQATATKLGIYSTYSQRNSIQF